ncbi:MAG: zf-HC2 domain-containing protein [Clostridia bacterium]|nr:zf-HC2 domain-containing protein [Clostridia bacterium]
MTRIFRQRQPNNTPLTCEDARELMFDYIDGELSACDTARLEAHLADCEACRHELEERRAILTIIAETPMNAPASLYPGVMALIDGVAQEPRRKLTASRILPWGTLVAAAAMVTLFVLHRGMFGLQDSLSADMAAPEAANITAADTASAQDVDAAYDYGAADDRVLYSVNGASRENGDVQDSTASYSGSQFKLSGSTAPETTGAVLETTAVTALNPTELNDTAPTVALVESSAYTELLSKLVSDGIPEQTALLICAEDALNGLFADVAELSDHTINTLTFDGESAVTEFTGYLTLLKSSGEDYEYYIPEDAAFNRYLVVLVDGNAEEIE